MTLDKELIKKQLNEYFEYIKTIYINEFNKYLKANTKKQIEEMKDVFELNEELSFRCSVNGKIIINLDLKKYVEENHLKQENINDLSVESQNYINSLVENENNVYEIIKRKILNLILTLFTFEGKDVIAIGTVKMIEERLVSKYKLPHESYFNDKEKEVAIYISQIIGEDLLLSAIMNNDQDLVRKNYNLYVENETDSYDALLKSVNKIYVDYTKKIGKVYLTDSLYEYDKLDYNVRQKTNQIQEEKKNINITRLKRLMSIKNSISDIYNYIKAHQILFNALEKREIENAIIEINKIIERLKRDGKDNIISHINEEYPKILEIENDCMKFVLKIWQNVLTSPDKFRVGSDFYFLMGKASKDEVVEATYISSEHLKQIRTLKNTYGFIYEPLNGGVVYSSTDDVMYKKYSRENYKSNCNTIYVGNTPIEIDNQSDSKLISPTVILKKNIEVKTIQNKVILDATKSRIVGIYCFVDEDLENNSNYNKALELAENNDLPLVKINKDLYFSGIETPKIEVKIDHEEMNPKRQSIFEKIKETRDRVLYEDAIVDFKKTL